MIDLDALKARLAEYDDARPRCQGKVARSINCAPDNLPSDDPTYPDYVFTTYSPCCRPEGHADECRNSRSILGWPGFVTLSALVAEVERLREHQHGDGKGRRIDAYLAGALDERDAVVTWLREVRDTSETAYASDDLDYAIAVIERGGHRKETS